MPTGSGCTTQQVWHSLHVQFERNVLGYPGNWAEAGRCLRGQILGVMKGQQLDTDTIHLYAFSGIVWMFVSLPPTWAWMQPRSTERPACSSPS